MYFLGLDIGSSSVKLSILNAEAGHCVAQTQQPQNEFVISAPQSGWAEQDPQLWWDAVKAGMQQLLYVCPEARERIAAMGISYQMHGLVAVDKNQRCLYPSIIWCDS